MLGGSGSGSVGTGAGIGSRGGWRRGLGIATRCRRVGEGDQRGGGVARWGRLTPLLVLCTLVLKPDLGKIKQTKKKGKNKTKKRKLSLKTKRQQLK